jgi:diaminopimelate epimerase
MKKFEFSKFNGQGNDFVLIDGTKNKISFSEEQIKNICDRHFGIGADGMIIVRKSEKADFFMDYYNMDGSIAGMCGNGIRCMAAFIYVKGLSRKNRLCIDTLAGKRDIKIGIKNGMPSFITVDMGRPFFKPEDIPVNIDSNEVFGYRLSTEAGDFDINCVSVGNPHCVIYIEKDEDIQKIPVEKWGPVIERNIIFPEKTNVEFLKVRDESQIDMRVWERGVGETLACGTGACASGVCSIKLGKIKSTTVKVNTRGGILYVSWKTQNSSILLVGTVEHSFDGVYYL